jgi:hypothetical protein
MGAIVPNSFVAEALPYEQTQPARVMVYRGVYKGHYVAIEEKTYEGSTDYTMFVDGANVLWTTARFAKREIMQDLNKL